MTRASMFYAESAGARCEGDQVCHYCAAPCTRLWLHREPPPVPFARSTTTARRPDSPYMCSACWHWQRRRVSVSLLSGGQKDGRCALRLSWLITESGGLCVDLPACKDRLYKTLLGPPLRFVLALQEGDAPPDNLLQLHLLNDNPRGVSADTELHYTVNNVPHAYCVHELEEALAASAPGAKQTTNGLSGGVRALLRLLGPPGEAQATPPKEKLPRGRPAVDEKGQRPDRRPAPHDRLVSPASGSPAVSSGPEERKKAS